MPPTISHPYVVYNPETRDHLFRLDDHSKRLVTGAAFENRHCHQPAHLAQEMAEALAAELNLAGGTRDWTARITHADCPSCGRELWDNDLDVCYPQNRERTSWRIGCNLHDFGCGLELTGDSYEDAVVQWNSYVPYHYDAARYVKPTGRRRQEQEELLKAELKVEDNVTEEDFLRVVGPLCDDESSPLMYVARHYLVMYAATEHW